MREGPVGAAGTSLGWMVRTCVPYFSLQVLACKILHPISVWFSWSDGQAIQHQLVVSYSLSGDNITSHRLRASPTRMLLLPTPQTPAPNPDYPVFPCTFQVLYSSHISQCSTRLVAFQTLSFRLFRRFHYICIVAQISGNALVTNFNSSHSPLSP